MQHRAGDADGEHAHDDDVRPAKGPPLLDHVSQPGGGRDQLRRHQCGPCVSQRHPDAGEGHRHGGGDADRGKDLPPAGAAGLCHADQHRIGQPDAGVGVDHTGDKGGDKNDERLGRGADAQPDQRQRDPRNGRDGPHDLKDGGNQLVQRIVIGEEQPQGHAHRHSQRVAAEHQLEAGPQVDAQHRAVGLRVGELDKKRLQNRGGGAQILGVHHPQPDGGLPQRQQHKDCPSGQHQQPQLFPPLVLPLFSIEL